MGTKMTDAPKYFIFWEEYGNVNSITFDHREDCQGYVKRVHLREGYVDGSLRVITGFELELDRGSHG